MIICKEVVKFLAALQEEERQKRVEDIKKARLYCACVRLRAHVCGRAFILVRECTMEHLYITLHVRARVNIRVSTHQKQESAALRDALYYERKKKRLDAEAGFKDIAGNRSRRN